MARTSRTRTRSARGTAGSRRRRASKEQAAAISYLNPTSLTPFLTARGKIKSRNLTGLSRRDQSRLGREVKRARELALLPYTVQEPGVGKRESRRERS